MSMLNLNISIQTGAIEIGEAFVNILREKGFAIDHQQIIGENQIIIASQESVNTTTPSIDIPAPALTQIDVPIPTSVLGLDVTEPIEIPAIAPVSVGIPSNSDNEKDKTTFIPSGEVCLKSLSVACTIPYIVDESLKCSELHVLKLDHHDGTLQFEYCSMTYRYQVELEDSGNMICNINPDFTSTSFRTVCEIIGTPILIPVLLKVVLGSECKVVFGSDVVPLLNGTKEVNLNGTVPA